MLGTVLDRITKLFGRAFFIGAFFPVVLFVAVNVLVGAQHFGWSQTASWWKGIFENKALSGLLLLIGVTAASYLVMILGPMLKRVVEGRYPLGRLGTWLRARKIAQFTKAETELQSSLSELHRQRDRRDGIRDRLVSAFEARQKAREPEEVADEAAARLAELGREIDALWGEAGDFAALESLATKLGALYGEAVPTPEVTDLHRRLDQLLEDTVKVAERRYGDALSEINASFDRGTGTAGVRVTTLGNVMNAIWAYPHSRYGIDPVAAWPPLQTVIPKEYYPTVEDARISYDFAVLCTYLSAIVALFWLIVGGGSWLLQEGGWSVPLAPTLAVLGGIAGVLAFRALAVEAARSFGAVFRTCFDLFRFELLKRLSFPLPPDLAAERKLWERVNQLLVYGDWSQELTYAHAGKPAKKPGAAAG